MIARDAVKMDYSISDIRDRVKARPGSEQYSGTDVLLKGKPIALDEFPPGVGIAYRRSWVHWEEPSLTAPLRSSGDLDVMIEKGLSTFDSDPQASIARYLGLTSLDDDSSVLGDMTSGERQFMENAVPLSGGFPEAHVLSRKMVLSDDIRAAREKLQQRFCAAFEKVIFDDLINGGKKVRATHLDDQKSGSKWDEKFRDATSRAVAYYKAFPNGNGFSLPYPRGTSHGDGLTTDESLIVHLAVANSAILRGDEAIDAGAEAMRKMVGGSLSYWKRSSCLQRRQDQLSVKEFFGLVNADTVGVSGLPFGARMILAPAGRQAGLGCRIRSVQLVSTYANGILHSTIRPSMEIVSASLGPSHKMRSPTDLQALACAPLAPTTQDGVGFVLGTDYSKYDIHQSYGEMEACGDMYVRIAGRLGLSEVACHAARSAVREMMRFPLILGSPTDIRGPWEFSIEMLNSGGLYTSRFGTEINLKNVLTARIQQRKKLPPDNFDISEKDFQDAIREMLISDKLGGPGSDWRNFLLGDDFALADKTIDMDQVVETMNSLAYPSTREGSTILSFSVSSRGATRSSLKSLRGTYIREYGTMDPNILDVAHYARASTMAVPQRNAFFKMIGETRLPLATNEADAKRRFEVASRKIAEDARGSDPIPALRALRAVFSSAVVSDAIVDDLENIVGGLAVLGPTTDAVVGSELASRGGLQDVPLYVLKKYEKQVAGKATSRSAGRHQKYLDDAADTLTAQL